ncbi:hypothetical protein F4776DRAFT_276804 [Hypoxylon sp. NC0597]|nr:hypothetical protein F4776DRAFT_276804 [Hypoxylon sp. NC0597]
MSQQTSSSVHFQFITGNSRVHNGHTYSGPATEHGPYQRDDQRGKLVKDPLTRIFDTISFNHVHRNNLRPPSPRTCEWILKAREYVSWLDPGDIHCHHGLLWIKGKPGVGKSILMNYLLAGSAQAIPDAISISFFFNARGHELERTAIGLYRSLLSQLMTIITDLRKSFAELGFTDPDSVEQSGWQEQGLKNVFSHVISKLQGRQVICYIDALDECPEEQAREIVSFFQELSEQVIERGNRINICLSSRHYPNISLKKGLYLTIEDQPAHMNDIRLFVDHTLIIDSPICEQNIKSRILQKSCGVFLWVALVIPMLNKAYDSGKLDALNEKLDILPSQLSLLFHDIITRDPEDQNVLLLCIQLILFARRPLTLLELYYAIHIGLDHPTTPSVPVNEKSMRHFILSSSKGLLEEVSTTYRAYFQFIHESVRGYFLLQEDKLQEIWPHLSTNFRGQGQDAIKRVCFKQIQRISLPRRDEVIRKRLYEGSSPQWERKLVLERSHPFLKYAIPNVFSHSNTAQALGVQQSNWLQSFPLATWAILLNILSEVSFEELLYDLPNHGSPRRSIIFKPTVSMLYVLAQLNMVHLMRQCPDRMHHLDIREGYYGTPLVAALACGSRQAARYLGLELFLDQGLDISASEQDETYFSQLVCNHAFNPSRKSLFASLFQLGCLPASKAVLLVQGGFNQPDDTGWTPLFHAARSKSVDTVRWLCSNENTSPDVVDRDECTVLGVLCKMSSREYDESEAEICRLLLAHPRTKPDVQDLEGRTPFSYAVSNHRLDIAKMLLSTGSVNPNTVCRLGRSPLFYAASVPGGGEMVHWLLSSDTVDPNHEDSLGRTVLSYAACSHYLTDFYHDTLRTFISSKRVLKDSKDLSGRTPLSHAPQNGQCGQEEVISLVLETNKVDVNSRDNLGCTPLSYAVRGGAWDNIEALLSSGKVDVDCCDNRGWTPLRYAVVRGRKCNQLPVILSLLRTGQVNVDSKAMDGMTPLTSTRLFLEEMEDYLTGLAKCDIEKYIDAMERYKRGEDVDEFEGYLNP